jgi:hypothetical protein
MSTLPILRLGTVKDVAGFQEHVRSLGLNIPCDSELLGGSDSPLRRPLTRGGIKIATGLPSIRWKDADGAADGNPERAYHPHRWKKFRTQRRKIDLGGGSSCGFARGRANPNQLVIARHTLEGLAGL